MWQLMKTRILLTDYDQILFSRYQYCHNVLALLMLILKNSISLMLVLIFESSSDSKFHAILVAFVTISKSNLLYTLFGNFLNLSILLIKLSATEEIVKIKV